MSLLLGANPLRQWLAILHGRWQSAGWPEGVWPQWLREPSEEPAKPQSSMH